MHMQICTHTQEKVQNPPFSHRATSSSGKFSRPVNVRLLNVKDGPNNDDVKQYPLNNLVFDILNEIEVTIVAPKKKNTSTVVMALKPQCLSTLA